ncbi:cob(I)yrinic acid a,c-diamide adenosyltransferase [Candidatus Nitrotoga sp. M5]|uniref:cob(I)yrinic acid a,c-diamide adenosyltransferase n=1 Tax=Candidatus Nitrotoga sp. M5 TaxID=2890409 RepID=UPI001EF3BB1F|nr:cob(I)yrinic acid a,c-diamide adenosyltransferase [Candidatus Nitrotoga sp. M5]CAH1385720.1 Cobalamin adenosyltransferase [Candidatus Nitrotoga sp. M5]
MANRLSKIVTRTGDKGTTGLADGTRVEKHCARIHAIGSIDELNSHLGVLLAETLLDDVRDLMLHIQHDLFDLGGALAYPAAQFTEDKLLYMDTAIAHYNADLPPLKEFILPGGTRAAAQCHVARTVARRAERDFNALAQLETVPQYGLPYLNRLSDLLFILCREINRTMGQKETLWQR